MPHFVFESLGMLLLPLFVIVSAVPKQSLPISRAKYALLSLPLVWPLSMTAHLAFAEQSQVQVAAVFGATALGVVAALICVQAFCRPASSLAVQPTMVVIAEWWQSGWRLLVLWFVLAILLGALAGVGVAAAGYPSSAGAVGGVGGAIALLLASLVLHLRACRVSFTTSTAASAPSGG